MVFKHLFGLGGDTFIKDGTTTIGMDTLAAGDKVKYGIYIIKPELIADLLGKFALSAISGSADYINGSEDFRTIYLDFY